MPHTIKDKIISFIENTDISNVLAEIREFKPEKVINALISLFFHKDNFIKHTAIYLFGIVVSDIADKNLEQARVVMRRLMWSLNEESGGIGWGSPEAMAEVMANNKVLANEYFNILFSYIREDGNFLEFTPLRRGALWGLTRLAPLYPELFIANNAEKYLKYYVNSQDDVEKALASLCMSYIFKKIST